MSNLLNLREDYRSGRIDKHIYSKSLLSVHSLLGEYRALLVDSDIDRIEIGADGIWLYSNLAPICMELSLIDRGTPGMNALNFGQYERPEFDMWQKLVANGATIADIGANIGWYSIHWAAIDPSSHIFSFEPVPSTYESLTKNVNKNNLMNIVVENMGMSSSCGSLEIFVDPSIAGAASAHPSVYGASSMPVQTVVTTLDDYAKLNTLHFDAVKLDVEGGELAVLQGASQVLSDDRPIIFIEMLRRHARAFGYHPNDIIALMKTFDYDCFRIESGVLLPFLHMDEHTIDTNFFFIHRSRHDLINHL